FLDALYTGDFCCSKGNVEDKILVPKPPKNCTRYEVIKSSVENLVPIPSESEGIPEHKCDVPFHDNSPPLDVSKYQIEDLFDSNEEFSLVDDDSFSIDNIEYVEAPPLDSELVSSEVMEIAIPEVKEKEEKDKIGTKPDKNGKCGEAEKSQKTATVKRARKTEENAS
nr:hypothetical protein [Tanacetum cinerariifolium]